MSKEYCKNTDVNSTMTEAIEDSRTIPFNNNSFIYLNNIYNLFQQKMDTNETFLKDMECVFSHNLFQEILNETHNYTSSRINLDSIKANDILFIFCPSIFATYHYIVVVVNEDKTQVAIYQSFGSTIRLHQIIMEYNRFIELMTKISTFNQNNKFEDDFIMMIPIESELYGLDTNKYIQKLEDYYHQNEDDEDDDEDDEDDITIGDITISSTLYDNLERQHSLNNGEIKITAYRVRTGGKKRNTRKKRTKKNNNKSKRIKRIRKNKN